MPEAGKELRLALGMRGGVSLAVWIGGVCAEIDELRRARREGGKFWDQQLQASEFDRVVVDVMAGASAGGLNGVLFASSIRFGFPMSCMRDIWKEVGDIDSLRREEAPWTSVLDGDGVFLRTVFEKLHALVPRPDHPPSGGPSFLDLRLSATLVEPVVMGAVGPDDEPLSRTRSSAMFHFRCTEGVPVPSDDFSGEIGVLRRLALAARATASFPIAFEPAVVRSNRPSRFGQQLPLVDGPLVDCGDVFSERNGARDNGSSAKLADFLVADGGVVDNIPLGKAIEAVGAAPATGPTKRYLLYLHPSGPPPIRQTSEGDEPEVNIDKRRGVEAVVRGLLAARVANESIAGDIDQLEAQVRAANLACGLRKQIDMSLTGTDVAGAADMQLPTYLVQRAVVGATYLRRLLDDPIAFLGSDPFPEAPPGYDYDPPSDRWRAPLTKWSPDARNDLDAALAEARGGPPVVDVSILMLGLGPLQRVTRLCIEWLRALEESFGNTDCLGEAKAALYRVRWLLSAVLDRYRNLGWVTRAGVSPKDIRPQPWCADTTMRLDQMLRLPRGVADVIAGGNGDATRTYMQTCDRALALLMKPTDYQTFENELASGGDTRRWVDIRDVLLAYVGARVDLVVKATATLSADSSAALLDRILRRRGKVGLRLAHMEILCFPEFLSGATGGQPIEFRRISAAAPTPLAEAFKALALATRKQEGEDIPGDRLAPDVKLAGNELSNFSAFFKKEWRDNDWLWGRLDAVPTLVDLLLPPGPGEEPLAFSTLGPRGELVRRRQEEIIREHFHDVAPEKIGEFLANYRVGLEKLDEISVPGVGESLEALASTAAQVAAAFAPSPIQKYVLWPVRHVAGLLVRRLIRAGTPPGPDVPQAGVSLPRRVAGNITPWAIAFLITVVTIWLAFGLADSKVAVAGGFLAGILVGPVPVLLLWHRLQRPTAVRGRPVSSPES